MESEHAAGAGSKTVTAQLFFVKEEMGENWAVCLFMPEARTIPAQSRRHKRVPARAPRGAQLALFTRTFVYPALGMVSLFFITFKLKTEVLK